MSFGSVDWHPSERHLRRFGIASVFVFGALGAWGRWRESLFGFDLAPAAARVAMALVALAAVCGLLAWVAPRALRPLYVGLMAVSVPIGFVVAHVVMGIVFYGVVTPIGLAFRAMGRDALERTLDPRAATYWTRRNPPADASRYYRQF